MRLLDGSVIVRPNGDTLQIVRVNGALRYVPVDVEALVRYSRMVASAAQRPANRCPADTAARCLISRTEGLPARMRRHTQ